MIGSATVAEALDDYHKHVRSDVFDVVPTPAGRVLDLGGGIGATGAALKRAHGATFVVVADLVAETAAAGVDVAVGGNLEDTDFLRKLLDEHGPFDTILCLDVLEHLRDPWTTVSELHHGLAPTGAIVASIPNVNHYSLVFPLLFRGRYELQDAGILDRTHIRWFTRDSAIEMMTRSGLKLESANGWLGRKNKLLKMITFGLSERFTVLQYIIRVRRTA
jgi:2-polyprenyl-3-methyl-5-hydroxy-6-metoxy-1,4-benzoquinol methylase